MWINRCLSIFCVIRSFISTQKKNNFTYSILAVVREDVIIRLFIIKKLHKFNYLNHMGLKANAIMLIYDKNVVNNMILFIYYSTLADTNWCVVLF